MVQRFGRFLKRTYLPKGDYEESGYAEGVMNYPTTPAIREERIREDVQSPRGTGEGIEIEEPDIKADDEDMEFPDENMPDDTPPKPTPTFLDRKLDEIIESEIESTTSQIGELIRRHNESEGLRKQMAERNNPGDETADEIREDQEEIREATNPRFSTFIPMRGDPRLSPEVIDEIISMRTRDLEPGVRERVLERLSVINWPETATISGVNEVIDQLIDSEPRVERTDAPTLEATEVIEPPTVRERAQDLVLDTAEFTTGQIVGATGMVSRVAQPFPLIKDSPTVRIDAPYDYSKTTRSEERSLLDLEDRLLSEGLDRAEINKQLDRALFTIRQRKLAQASRPTSITVAQPTSLPVGSDFTEEELKDYQSGLKLLRDNLALGVYDQAEYNRQLKLFKERFNRSIQERKKRGARGRLQSRKLRQALITDLRGGRRRNVQLPSALEGAPPITEGGDFVDLNGDYGVRDEFLDTGVGDLRFEDEKPRRKRRRSEDDDFGALGVSLKL